MIRRLALLLALLAPVAGLAQNAGEVLIVPATFGVADCTSTTKLVTLSWTSPVTPVTGDLYRILLSTTSGCPSGSPVLADNIAAASATQGYPTVGSTLTRSDFITTAGVSSCAAAATIYACVQLWPSTGTGGTLRGTATGSAKLEVLPPPVPVSVSVQPGDSSLFVSWADGASTGVAAASYSVVAVATTDATDLQVQSFTGGSNNRVSGLTNGVTYAVTVAAVSAGGNTSAASKPPVMGTPAPVAGFWQQYQAAGGIEQGGCGGGPAGALALLGVALALRGLRRRS